MSARARLTSLRQCVLLLNFEGVKHIQRNQLVPSSLSGFDVATCSILVRDLDTLAVHLRSLFTRPLTAAQLDTSTSPVLKVSPPAAKECTSCHQVKPASEFHRHGRSRDMLQHFCKSCQDAEQQKAYVPVTVTEKLCPRCQEIKPSSAFSRSRQSRSGLQGRCKVCSNAGAIERQRQMGEANRELGRPQVNQQECSICGEVKPASDFDRDLARTSGITACCKACRVQVRKRVRQRLPKIFWSAPEKACGRCNEVKPQGEFYRLAISADGLSYYCKACSKSAAADRRARTQQAAVA